MAAIDPGVTSLFQGGISATTSGIGSLFQGAAQQSSAQQQQFNAAPPQSSGPAFRSHTALEECDCYRGPVTLPGMSPASARDVIAAYS
jgi:hypothetical protein